MTRTSFTLHSCQTSARWIWCQGTGWGLPCREDSAVRLLLVSGARIQDATGSLALVVVVPYLVQEQCLDGIKLLGFVEGNVGDANAQGEACSGEQHRRQQKQPMKHHLDFDTELIDPNVLMSVSQYLSTIFVSQLFKDILNTFCCWKT